MCFLDDTGNSIDRLERKQSELDQLRPLTDRSLAELDNWYDVELTYSSKALEGNTLTRSETVIVLEKGFAVSGKPLKDHLEATGHRDALGYVRELARTEEPIQEQAFGAFTGWYCSASAPRKRAGTGCA